MSIADKLTAVAENQQKVFDAGAKSEYDHFWDVFQKNGTRTSYTYGFAGTGWDETIFRPKYDLVFVGNQEYAFRHFPVNDFVGCLETAGVQFDLSGATNIQYMFATSKIHELPVLDCRKVTLFSGAFGWTSTIHTIQKIILKDDGTQDLSNAFTSCSGLENVTFDGVIGRNTPFLTSPLTVESMKNVIEHLANYAGTDNEFKYSVKFTNACWAALEADGASPSGGTWKDYVNTLGWTV